MHMLTTGQVAILLGVSSQTIRRMIADGTLPAQRLSDISRYRVPRDRLIEYAHQRNIDLDWSLLEVAKPK